MSRENFTRPLKSNSDEANQLNILNDPRGPSSMASNAPLSNPLVSVLQGFDHTPIL